MSKFSRSLPQSGHFNMQQSHEMTQQDRMNLFELSRRNRVEEMKKNTPLGEALVDALMKRGKSSS